MEYPQSSHNISIMWRRKKFTVDMDPHATLKELGDELQKLTNVKADTMRFIVPQINNKGSKLLTPFSNEHERLSLQESSIIEGKPIRMMGVSENEVDEVLQDAKANLRIAGFEEEEKRLRQRQSYRPHVSLQLPQGPYIFCDFRTLELPGIELNPPASEALKRMHRLAADPGIVAIMNKHHWRVGIMTEMAPVGYVGISPKCLLGFNKNHGEEISLRLRTDDLKGFRKYESIKKTLLHELAHMVHSEHDANFWALNKQLNQEAASLDWTRSTGYTLNGVGRSEDYEEDFYFDEGSNSSQKLGGDVSDQLASARATSVAAAYRRLANVSTDSLGISEVHEEPDPDDYEFHTHEEPDEMDYVGKENSHIYRSNKVHLKPYQEPDPDDHQNFFEPDPDDHQNVFEPDPDDHQNDFEPDHDEHQNVFEPDPDDSQGDKTLEFGHFQSETTQCVPLINRQLEASLKHSLVGDSEHSEELGIKIQAQYSINEPDPDELEAKQVKFGCLNTSESDEIAALITGTNEDQSLVMKDLNKDDHGESQSDEVMQAEPDPDDNLVQPVDMSGMQIDEPDPDDQELQRIQDPVRVFCNRLQKAIETLHTDVVPAQATVVLQTLFKIISNVIEHPGDVKYRRLRKDNPTIKRTVVNYKAAMEILLLIGFSEDLVTDELGKAETYLVLKRNDPGLFWLAKSSLETSISR